MELSALASGPQLLGLAVFALIEGAQISALVQLVRTRAISDRRSAWFLVAAWQVVALAAAAEALFAHPLWIDPLWSQGVGFGLFALGSALRTAAVHTLDRHFSPLVELQPEHALVITGPYAWVRHPAYLGSLAWALAMPFLLGAGAGFVAWALAYVPALCYRVRVEEAMLAEHFGPAWHAYAARTGTLLPLPRRRREPEEGEGA